MYLETSGRVLAKPECVQHLVNHERLDVSGIPPVGLPQPGSADEHHGLIPVGERQPCVIVAP